MLKTNKKYKKKTIEIVFKPFLTGFNPQKYVKILSKQQ